MIIDIMILASGIVAAWLAVKLSTHLVTRVSAYGKQLDKIRSERYKMNLVTKSISIQRVKLRQQALDLITNDSRVKELVDELRITPWTKHPKNKEEKRNKGRRNVLLKKLRFVVRNAALRRKVISISREVH